MRPTTRPSSRLATVLAIAQLCAALAVSGAAGQATATLVERIDSIVDAPPFGRAHWGIVVEDLASGERLYERNADRLFIPASSLKLVVATAAARLLGPGFRYTTELLATGPIEGGTLRGDIVIRGTGDPTLSGRYADSLTAVWASLADSLCPWQHHSVALLALLPVAG